MSIDTNAAISNGYFGILKKLKNGNTVFIKKGRAVYITAIEESIENDDVYLRLTFDYLGRTKTLRIQRDEIADPALLKILARMGGAGSRDSYSVLVDTLHLQEEDFEVNGQGVTPVYENLGWIRLPRVLDDGETIVFDLCYRASELIGAHEGTYIGPYDVRPYGEWSEWKRLVEEQVVGHSVLELLLIAALAAVVNGLIAPVVGGENPILHSCYSSGKGKSTGLSLCCSAGGKPFEGERVEYDENYDLVNRKSLFQSWSATDNAMVTSQAGNRGMPTILNELGKSLSPNMTRLIFDLSEGSDKKRLTKDLSMRVSEGYTTVFISCGESSLLDRCKSRYEGLRIRVMEINKPVTDSAEQARKIKSVCANNGGFAVPLLAKHIIDSGGLDYVLPVYNRWLERLGEEIPPTPSVERFIEKFAALLMCTAEIASAALGIAFDMDGLLAFLKDYDAENGPSRNTAASSYDVVLETCRINEHRFHRCNHRSFTDAKTEYEIDDLPNTECWGRITNMRKVYDDERVIVQEFEIRRVVLEKILRDNDFANLDTCVAAWKGMGVLDFEDAIHPTRSRKLDRFSPDGTKERVFVFRVFCHPDDVDTQLEAIKKREDAKKRSQIVSRSKSLVKNVSAKEAAVSSQMNYLLSAEDDCDDA